MTYQPKHLKRWERRDPCTGEITNYIGEWFPGYYVAPIFRSRDSDALTRSNWRVIQPQLAALGAQTHEFGHWACGRYELVLIDEDNEECLRLADEWAEKLEGYPVASEDDWSELETEEAYQWWKDMGLRTRAEMCKEAGVSIFAARQEDELPDSQRLWDLLTAA